MNVAVILFYTLAIMFVLLAVAAVALVILLIKVSRQIKSLSAAADETARSLDGALTRAQMTVQAAGIIRSVVRAVNKRKAKRRNTNE